MIEKLTQYKNILEGTHTKTTDYPKKTLIHKPEGRRNIGRQRTRRENDFREEWRGQEA